MVDLAVDREFDYSIPPSLADSVCVGTRVVVPFGRSKTSGYVVRLAEKSSHANLKEIISVVGDKPFLIPVILQLATWMAEYYCAPQEAAIRTVLPGAVRKKGAGFKEQLCVSLCEQGPDASAAAPKLSPKQQAVLHVLRLSRSMLLRDLLREARVTAAPVRALEKKGLVQIAAAPSMRDPLANRTILPTEPLPLMPEQANALAMILECLPVAGCDSGLQGQGPGGADPKMVTELAGRVTTGNVEPRNHVVLLYGVTGSGKTEVYLQAIDHVLKQGQGAIVLVPEIALTPQTVERFVGRFGERVAVLHSHLSEGERHDEWHRVRDGKASIVIGARSAVFAPMPNLGLIVVDEEHEPSYKQEEAPRYNARDVAVMRGRLQPCAVVLGSATPSLESWHNAKTGKYRLAVLPRRADNRKMPAVGVIDMRIESQRVGHASVLSKELIEAIRCRIAKAEQTILFLNRRGYSSSLVCPKCGYVAQCDQCSVSYTYHRSTEELRCHICGGSKKVPSKCPGCQDPAFKYSGMGTQRVEAIMKKCFPHARIQRMDTDVTGRKDAYERILGDFRVGKIDVLVGTQMIAKGLHFPNVTLVGVIHADLSLHMPDFRAGERSFQLLAQVAGRAGRGEVSGEVMVQTYTPHHVAVQAARRGDFEGFCDQELEFRRELGYPPFAHLICITLKGLSSEQTMFFAAALGKKLKLLLPGHVRMSSPAPAPLARAKGYYRFQIMLRSKSTRAMTEPIRKALAGFNMPRNMSCSVDVDAMALL